jgi:hypothetical protein
MPDISEGAQRVAAMSEDHLVALALALARSALTTPPAAQIRRGGHRGHHLVRH